ncbi:MAG: DMT family transporter [Cyanobacteria bacterium J06632_22]
MQLHLLLICLAAISWGTTGTSLVLLNRVTDVHPMVVGFWRMALSAPLLLLWAGKTLQPGQLTVQQWRLLLSMGACIASYQVCYFCAVPFAGVAVTALVAICSSPVLIALMAALLLGERLTKWVYLSLGLGVAGTALLVLGPGEVATSPLFLVGVLLAFGAALSYAGYAVIAKVAVAEVAPVAIAAYGFTTAALLLTPTLLLQPPWPDFALALPWLLYLGLVTTGVAYGIYMIGIRTTPATIAGIAVLLEPLTATLIGVGIFKESIGIVGVLGAILLLSAIALLVIAPNAKPDSHA